MQVLDPGHRYLLRTLDGDVGPLVSILQFVKRSGPGYPGNEDAYPGTQTQEVLRALIDRTKYVDNQIPDRRNDQVLWHLRNAMFELEFRAAERHDRVLPLFDIGQIELIPTCDKCGHIGCKGTCH